MILQKSIINILKKMCIPIGKDIGAKNLYLDLVVSTFLTVGSAILITNLSDKIYL